MSDPDKDCAPGTIVPNALLPKVGRITVLFTQLDIEMNRTIWRLMGVVFSMGRVITQNILNFSTRADIFLQLGELKFPPEQHARLREIKNQLRVASEDRNRLIHDEPHDGSAAELSFSVRRGDPTKPNLKVYVFDKPALDDLTERLITLRGILMLMQKNRPAWLTEPLPSLDKSPTQRLELNRQTPSNPDKPKRLRQSSRQRREQALAEIASKPKGTS